jgi:hypothetical protein
MVPNIINIAYQIVQDAKAQAVWNQSLKTLTVIILLGLLTYLVLRFANRYL